MGASQARSAQRGGDVETVDVGVRMKRMRMEMRRETRRKMFRKQYKNQYKNIIFHFSFRGYICIILF